MRSQRTWSVKPREAVPPELAEFCVGRPYLAEVLAQRGIRTSSQAASFLEHSRYEPAPADALAGVTEGAELLRKALAAKSRILIWGDFDADGQTSTALLVSGLRRLAQSEELVQWHLPSRLQDGHGIQPERLRKWLTSSSWRPDVLLTCDTGIDDVEGLSTAHDAGLETIVTDHHALPADFGPYEIGRHAVLEPAEETGTDSIRPFADVIINPQIMAPDHPQAALPGVGVAFQLMRELYGRLGRQEETEELLDLVALGIVADVADQASDTRYWLQRGLEVLNQSGRVGIHALMRTTRGQFGSLRTEDIAFSIAPLMNAAGRLADAGLTVQLLLTRDADVADAISGRLSMLNKERKALTESAYDGALRQLRSRPAAMGERTIVLAHKEWHPGVLGPVASRISDAYGMPSILMRIQNDGTARGSARSVDGVDIGAALEDCREHLLTWGGHAQAAGLSLATGRLNAFRKAVDAATARHTRHDDSVGELVVDRELDLSEVTTPLWRQVQELEPTGKGNPEFLCLSRNLLLQNWRRMGRKNSSMRRFQVTQPDSPSPIPAVWFRCPFPDAPEGPVDLVYNIRMNRYRGAQNLELLVQDCRPHEAPSVRTTELSSRIPYVLEDLRADAAALPPASQEAVCFGEGLHVPTEGYCTRLEVIPSEAEEEENCTRLVIWTSPPSRAVLREILTARSWTHITLMANEGPSPSAGDLPETVFRMCRFTSSSRHGQLEVPRMASKLGLTETVIRLSLTLLAEEGLIETSGETVRIPDETFGMREKRELIRKRGRDTLREALEEIRSFRVMYQTADANDLLL